MWKVVIEIVDGTEKEFKAYDKLEAESKKEYFLNKADVVDVAVFDDNGNPVEM